MGSGNYTIMFGEDYLELLGVLHETEQNKPTRDFLKNREGIERTAFTTDDAAAGAADLKARGLEPLGPVHFGRRSICPDGGKGEARFNVFRWPLSESPGGHAHLRLPASHAEHGVDSRAAEARQRRHAHRRASKYCPPIRRLRPSTWAA